MHRRTMPDTLPLAVMSIVEVSVPVERSKTEGATLKSTDSKSQTPCQGAKGSGDTASVTALYTALTVLLKIPKGTVHCCITLKAEKKRGCDIYSVHLCIVRTWQTVHLACNPDL